MKRLEINKKDLKNNLSIIRNIIGENKTKIIAVVKANGMGLGLVEYAKFLTENEIDYLAVANIDEALALRKANINTKILMLTPIIAKKNCNY